MMTRTCPLRAFVWNEDLGKFILRLSIAGLMLFHGFKKFFGGIAFVKMLVVQAGLPEFFAYGVYMGELIVPCALILGFYTRISALFLSGTMVFAIFLAYGNRFMMIEPKTGGLLIELPLLFLLTSFSLVLLGGGRYSLDNRIFQPPKN